MAGIPPGGFFLAFSKLLEAPAFSWLMATFSDSYETLVIYWGPLVNLEDLFHLQGPWYSQLQKSPLPRKVTRWPSLGDEDVGTLESHNLPAIGTVSQWSLHSWDHHSKCRNVSDFVFRTQELGYNWRCCWPDSSFRELRVEQDSCWQVTDSVNTWIIYIFDKDLNTTAEYYIVH